MIITNGVTIAAGRTVIVNCISSATGSASAGELHVDFFCQKKFVGFCR